MFFKLPWLAKRKTPSYHDTQVLELDYVVDEFHSAMADIQDPLRARLHAALMNCRTPRDLGHLVRHVRTLRRMTQVSLASLVGASRKWVIDLEAGKATADLSLVLRTLNALGIELDARVRQGAASPASADIDDIVASARRRK